MHFPITARAEVPSLLSPPLKITQLVDHFHTYGLAWNEDGLYTYIDDDEHKILEIKRCTSVRAIRTYSCILCSRFPAAM